MVSVSRRAANRLLAASAFLAAAACPLLIWRDLIAKLGDGFRFEPVYLLSSWTGFACMATGLAVLLPLVLSAGSDPAGRFHPRRRETIAGWGASFYLLGLLLVVQLATIVGNS